MAIKAVVVRWGMERELLGEVQARGEIYRHKWSEVRMRIKLPTVVRSGWAIVSSEQARWWGERLGEERLSTQSSTGDRGADVEWRDSPARWRPTWHTTHSKPCRSFGAHTTAQPLGQKMRQVLHLRQSHTILYADMASFHWQSSWHISKHSVSLMLSEWSRYWPEGQERDLIEVFENW